MIVIKVIRQEEKEDIKKVANFEGVNIEADTKKNEVEDTNKEKSYC